MAALSLIGVGVLALLVAILFAALVELFRDVRQVRDTLGILDRPLQVDVTPIAGTRPSAYGLPHVLDSAASALVLFLTDRCSSCYALADSLGGRLPPALWLVLEPRNDASADAFIKRFAFADGVADGRVIIDAGEKIANRIRLETAPVAFRVEGGLLAGATTVPSSRYLTSILPQPILLKRAG